MLEYILAGLVLGLGLAVSLGPIFIALTQTSIEKGILPGLTVGSGIWISDVIFIALSYNFISSIKSDIESDAFRFWMGISGAIILIGFGLYLLWKKPELEYGKQKHNYRNYIGFWMKGFLVNSVNPFTFFFWIGITSTYIIGRGISHENAIALLTTILTVIILSDAGKVLLANYLRTKLNSGHVKRITNFSGAILVIFGLVMGYQVV